MLRFSVVAGFAILTLTAACSVDTGDAADATEGQSDELRSVASSLTETATFSGYRVDALRRAFVAIDGQGSFVRNSDTRFGVRWTRKSSAPLTAAARIDLAQQAYTFVVRNADPSASSRRYIKKLTAVTASPENFEAALGNVGLTADGDDTKSAKALAALQGKLADVVALDDVHVYTGDLPENGLDWQGVLVVVDEKNHEVLFEAGGFGN